MLVVSRLLIIFDILNLQVINIVKFFQKQAAPPSVIADSIFSAAGRLVVVDQGVITVLFRMLLKVIDWCFLSTVLSIFAKDQADFKKVKEANAKSK